MLLSTFRNFTSLTWNLQPARGGITIHRRIKKHTLSEHLHMHSIRQPIFSTNHMFKLQPSCIVLETANVCGIIEMKQDDDDTDRGKISDDNSADPGVSTISCDIKRENLDNPEDVLHRDHERWDKILRTTRVLLLKKWNRVNTVIAHTSLPNVWYPAGAMAPPSLKRQRQRSTYYTSLTLDLPRRFRFPRLVLAMGLGNTPAVQVWTPRTGQFRSRPIQKANPLTLGGPNPHLYPLTLGLCRVSLEPSVPISGSVFRVLHLSSHSDWLLFIVQYWHLYITVYFQPISRLHVYNKYTHAPYHILKMGINWASTIFGLATLVIWVALYHKHP